MGGSLPGAHIWGPTSRSSALRTASTGRAARTGRAAPTSHGRGGRSLDAAARELGVKTLTLLDREDGMLPWLDAGRLEADVAAAIRRQRPEAVITFDEDGAYGHPDHRAVHARTTAAVAALGTAAPALYYVTMPPGAMRAVADHAARAFRDRSPRGTGRSAPTSILGLDDPDAFGAEAPAPSLVVDAGAFATAKLAALACHATQFRCSALETVAPADAARLLGIEHYRRAAVGAAGTTFLDAFAAPAAEVAARSTA